MSDYYSMLLEAIGNLNEAGAQSRRSFYERAQTMMLAELTRRTPRPSAPEIDEEFRSLAKAIQRIESEFSRMLDEDGFARSRDVLLKILAGMPEKKMSVGERSTSSDLAVRRMVELL